MIAIFQDRQDAGRALASSLRNVPGLEDATVLALPRGGVPVAFEVAQALHLPLDVFVVRKLGVPGQEELAMGAVATGGVVVLQPEVVRAFGIRPEIIDAVVARERIEILRREAAYRGSHPSASVAGRAVILVDDGLATGSSMKAAARALRPAVRHLVVAVPVAARRTCEELRSEVDQLVCPQTPEPFHAVGEFYHDFSQTSDEEVRALLAQAHRSQPGPKDAPHTG